MKVENILDAIGAINDEAVQDARAYKKARHNKAVKCGAMAACLVFVLAISIPVIIIQTRPMGGEDIIEIKQAQSDTAYLNADQIYRPAVVQVDEPQFDKQFPATLPCYSVIAETVFTEDVIKQFAEKAKVIGIFNSYSIEMIHGGFALINSDVAGSHSYEGEGGYQICEVFMQESGVIDWLHEQNISVTASPWYSDTYHLVIDGNVFSDCISFDITDDGKIAGCIFSIKDYTVATENVPVLELKKALSNAFFIDKEQNLENEILHISNVQIMHFNGMPIYFFTGSVVLGENKYGASYDGYAFAFSVNSDNAESVSAFIQQLIVE